MLHDPQLSNVSNKSKSQKLPQHVAIIMDGNGRWAQERRKSRVWGHKMGAESVKEAVKTAAELGISFLTLYAFSEENWGRPRAEVSALMSLLESFVLRERKVLDANNVVLKTIGDLTKIPEGTRKRVNETVRFLSKNNGLTLVVAISYGARTELSEACRLIAEKVKRSLIEPDDIDANLVEKHLSTSEIPDPDLLIRTSGEKRVSNFLLWQIAYSELWFSKVFWPDFRREHFLEAIHSFANRSRRFGLVESVHSTV